MNPYLAKLRARDETHHPHEASKPSKLGFEGFEGDPSMPFFENWGAANVNDPRSECIVEDAKSATSTYPQSPQNFEVATCRVRVIELPRQARYRRTFAALQAEPPAYIDDARWKQCVEDGSRFLAKWGETAEQLGWTSADLFGLHKPVEQPHPSYSRLSRYDCTGLCWLLQGRCVIALTESTATIKNSLTGNITTYRKHHKPALGPLGDCLEDLDERPL